MKAGRCAVTGSALREPGDTEIDAVGGANGGPNSTWITSTTTSSTPTSPACASTTTTTSFTLETTGNEEKPQ